MGGSKHLGVSRNYHTWSLLCMLALNFCFLGPDNQPLQRRMVFSVQLSLRLHSHVVVCCGHVAMLHMSHTYLGVLMSHAGRRPRQAPGHHH